MADMNNLLNTSDHTAEMDPQDIEKNKIMAVLAYLSWLVLVPIFAAKDSKFARFHVNQGLVLAVVEIIVWIVLAVLGHIPVIGVIIRIVGWLLNACCTIFAIIGILNAVQGKAKDLPFIGGIRLLK